MAIYRTSKRKIRIDVNTPECQDFIIKIDDFEKFVKKWKNKEILGSKNVLHSCD